MRTVTVHEAKTHLSRLLADVENGDEVVIARGSTPIAKLVRFNGESELARRRRSAFGVDTSGFRVPDDFDAPLDDAVLALFE